MRFPWWLGCALAALVLLNIAAAVAALRPPQVAMALDPAQILPDAGAAYMAPVGRGGFVYRVEGDRDASARSSLRLFEDGRELKPGHVLHAEIRQKGAGRFSHWGDWLYFSTSDGTDPRHNGRVYSLTAIAALNPYLLVTLALLDLVCLAMLRTVLVRRFGAAPIEPGWAGRFVVPVPPPFWLALLVTAAAFGLAWFCGLTYRTNDDPSMRMIAEDAGSEFLFNQNIIEGLLLRSLYGIAPHIPWYDLMLAAGIGTGALLLQAALLRLCGLRYGTIFCALLGLIVFAGIFQNLQFTAAAMLLAGGAVALSASAMFRPPGCARLRLFAVAAALAFFWGSLFRFEAAFLAAALAAPILMLRTRQGFGALLLPLAGLAIGIVLAVSGRGFDAAYNRFTPGWENVQAEKAQRLRVSEYLHTDVSREREMNAALAAVGWSRNDYDLITNWMFAVPDTFSPGRVTRFAELAPAKSWTMRVADLLDAMQPDDHVVWLFAFLCVLALVMARSFYALVVMLVSASWLATLMMALAIVYKPGFLHMLWVMCGTATLVAAATAFAGAPLVRREGYRLLEHRLVAAGALAALGCLLIWQVGDMWRRGRAEDELRARLARDLAVWPKASDLTVIAWDADFPLESWVQPFRAMSPQGRQLFRTTHISMTPLADPAYAKWGRKDTLWALCHVPHMYLVDARRGYTARHALLLSAYMREHHAETVTLVAAFDGEATTLLACRPDGK